MERIISFLGIFVFLGVAWAFSEHKKRVNFKLVGKGLLLQFIFAALVLWTKPGRMLFEGANSAVLKVTGFAGDGSRMVFGENFRDHFFAFAVLPTIIFLSSLMAVLFHLGIMQRVVGAFSWVMSRSLMVSGAESMVASAKIFVGGVEAAFTIRPYLDSLTRSELMAILTAGLATIAAGVLAAFAGMGVDAGHLIAAQVVSTIGSLVVAKILIPETESPQTQGKIKITVASPDVNLFDSACRGAVDGLKVAAIVGAVLISFVAATSMLNFFLSLLPAVAGVDLSVERILGWAFLPVVFLTGAEAKDCSTLGMLLGKKMFLNEFLAFMDLTAAKDTLSPRSTTLATYFLCGFGNFSAVAMQIGGFTSLMPERRHEIAQLGLRCLLGGTLASLISACIAGVLVS